LSSISDYTDIAYIHDDRKTSDYRTKNTRLWQQLLRLFLCTTSNYIGWTNNSRSRRVFLAVHMRQMLTDF